MGDRANIVIRDEYRGSRTAPEVTSHEAVFLYGHWSGSELPEALRRALLNGPDRWDDGPYLARIAFEHMVGDERGGTTGFGITTRLSDNEYDLLLLLPREARIVRVPEKHYSEHGFTGLAELPSIDFADYVTVERTWDNLTEVRS